MSDEPPIVYRTIVGIAKQAGGSVITLSCKHTIPALPKWNYRFGDPHQCYRCSAKEMAIHLAKKQEDYP